NEALDPGLARQAGKTSRRGVVHPVEALRTALLQDADAVDHGVVAGEERRQQSLVVDRDVEEPDLADIALQFQELGGGGVARADGDDIAALGQPLDGVASDEPRSAEDRHPVFHARYTTARRALAKPPRPGNEGGRLFRPSTA